MLGISAGLKSLDLGGSQNGLSYPGAGAHEFCLRSRCLSQLSELATPVPGSALGWLQVEVWQVLALSFATFSLKFRSSQSQVFELSDLSDLSA